MNKILLGKLPAYAGVVGIVALWTLIITALLRARLGFFDNKPISYLGVNPHTKLLFSTALIISAVCFILFGLYLKRVFRVHGTYIYFFIIGQIGQIVAGVVPDKSGSGAKVVHVIAAFTLAFSLPLLIGQFARSQKDSNYQKLYQGLFYFELAAFVIGIGLFISTKGSAVLDETLPTIAFDVWMIVLTHITLKKLPF